MKHDLSYRIDAVVILLDMCPPLAVRVVLRLYKRWLERDIPR
jgi:hypothetical protein